MLKGSAAGVCMTGRKSAAGMEGMAKGPTAHLGVVKLAYIYLKLMKNEWVVSKN
jgi:hypothetical protein